MIKKSLSLACLGVLMAAALYADFSYEQSTKITGGMMAGAMKIAGVLSRGVRDAGNATVMVKGDKMALLNPDTGTIIDLGAETITQINFRNKTYSVVTFAQMAQFMDRMSQKIKDQQSGKTDVNFKASVKETGQTKQIAGVSTREVLLTLVMEGTDKESGNKGSMTVASDMWLSRDVPGYQEVKSFYQRMAQKVAWAPGSQGYTMGRADMAKAFADLQKEAAKLDGVPVLQIVTMGAAGEGQPGQPSQTNQQAAPPPEQQESAPTSIGGALGRLGGGLGGLRRSRPKKEEPAQEQSPTSTSAPSSAQGALMETTTEISGFSTSPIDSAKFQVPTGFKQVESELTRPLR